MNAEGEVSFTATTATLKELFDRAPDLAQAEQLSRSFWNSLPAERRSVVLLAVRETLERVLHDLNHWVPNCVTPGGEEMMEIRILFQNAFLDQIAEAQKVKELQEERDTYDNLRQLIAELEAD